MGDNYNIPGHLNSGTEYGGTTGKLQKNEYQDKVRYIHVDLTRYETPENELLHFTNTLWQVAGIDIQWPDQGPVMSD